MDNAPPDPDFSAGREMVSWICFELRNVPCRGFSLPDISKSPQKLDRLMSPVSVCNEVCRLLTHRLVDMKEFLSRSLRRSTFEYPGCDFRIL